MTREVHHNTPEQVHNYMVEALKVVASAKVPDDLREAALPLAFNALASKQIFIDQNEVASGLLLARPGH